MHLRALLRELTELYGTPTDHRDRWTHRWEVTPSGRMNAIHVCVNVDEPCSRAVIWIFDPTTKPVYLNLNGESDLAKALARIKECVPRISSNGITGNGEA